MSPLAGHYWTLAVPTRNALRPVEAPLSVPWKLRLEDERIGTVSLTGLLRRVPNSLSLVMVVHGLGGRITGSYCVRAAIAAERARIATLRLSLRGADRQGEDFYHAGLTADLHAAVASPAASRYRRIYVLGYSLGGHVALRFATEVQDPRVKAVAAVCPPLDLALAAAAFDLRIAWFYRAWLLRDIKALYAEVAARRTVPTPVDVVRRVRHIRDFDALTVVPRFGFRDVDDYYSSMSVAPKLRELRVPSLVVASEQDPLVPAEVVRPALASTAPHLSVRWVRRGGHVGFSPALDLGVPGPLGLENQIMSWLHAQQRTEELSCDDEARDAQVQQSSSQSSGVLLLD